MPCHTCFRSGCCRSAAALSLKSDFIRVKGHLETGPVDLAKGPSVTARPMTSPEAVRPPIHLPVLATESHEAGAMGTRLGCRGGLDGSGPGGSGCLPKHRSSLIFWGLGVSTAHEPPT